MRSGRVSGEYWLYISRDAVDLTLSTMAALAYAEFDEESDEEIDPPGFAERGLQSTIDVDTLTQSIEWADHLSGTKDDSAAIDVIRYYIRFDAWPSTLGAPDPPPAEETLLQLDRAFVEILGEENPTQTCRRDGCDRGAIQFSALCRRHHFESIKKRPCPFDD
ncbi:MAG: hypothetical protein AAF432_12525 [Planctomycetota bacterium]